MVPKARWNPAVTQISPLPVSVRVQTRTLPGDCSSFSSLNCNERTLVKCSCPAALSPLSSCCLLSLSFPVFTKLLKRIVCCLCHLPSSPLLWVADKLVSTFTTAKNVLSAKLSTVRMTRHWTASPSLFPRYFLHLIVCFLQCPSHCSLNSLL